MSGLDGIAYLLWSTIGGAILVTLTMPPALLLVIAYRRGGPRMLWHMAALVSLALFAFLAWPDVAREDNWLTTLFAGFTTLVPPFTAAAALTAGVGAGRLVHQTLAAGSVGILTAALPFMTLSLFFGPHSVRLMAAAGLALTAYLALRHWITIARTRRSKLSANGSAV